MEDSKEMANFQGIFANIDFKAIAQNPDFKEDSVRAVIILPVLKALGYTENNIVRSKTLNHPPSRTKKPEENYF
ncbi:MAG: hypothetical protein LBS01_07175 [Prevotellaceae bacterium]|nr:hypothetical protein [Prevotellaceae bacterium]